MIFLLRKVTLNMLNPKQKILISLCIFITTYFLAYRQNLSLLSTSSISACDCKNDTNSITGHQEEKDSSFPKTTTTMEPITSRNLESEMNLDDSVQHQVESDSKETQELILDREGRKMFRRYGSVANRPKDELVIMGTTTTEIPALTTSMASTDDTQISSQEKAWTSESCQSMLNVGQWYQSNLTHSEHKTCSKDTECRASAWNPINCKWHKFTKEDSQQCLNNQKWIIFGDSRARQTYIGIKNFLTGNKTLYDEVEHATLDFVDEEINFSMTWLWIRRTVHKVTLQFVQLVDQLLQLDLDNDKEWPSLLILNSFLLHPTSHLNRSLCEEVMKTFEVNMTDTIMPKMLELVDRGIQRGKPFHILWLGNEDLDYDIYISRGSRWPDAQIDALRAHNTFMENLIHQQYTKNPIIRNSLSYVGLGTKTVFAQNSGTGEYLLGDGTHKLDRRVETTVPTSLWADTNAIFNFYCNYRMSFEEDDLCCS